jgi:hypothetical protein
MYHEFKDNPVGATARYQGKTVSLEGAVSEIVSLDRGEAAVHLADGGSRIAIATFPRQDEVSGVHVGETIKLRCAFDKFEFNTLWLSFCARSTAQNTGTASGTADSQVPSANLLYREYLANPGSAGAAHDGTIVEIEARRGNVIEASSGGVAVQIADQGKSNALVAAFPVASAVAGVEEGASFRMRCRVEKFEYLILWLEACQIAA